MCSVRYRISRKKIECLEGQTNSVNFSKKICPDQYLCRTVFDSSKKEWNIDNKQYICDRRFSHALNKRNYVNYLSIKPDDYLIIILESPHKDEYDKKGNAYGPAQGLTGCNICKYLKECLNKNSSNGVNPLHIAGVSSYQVVIVNAVQFQTSTGTFPLNKSIRNHNWRTIFKNCGDLDLRIQHFIDSSKHCIVSNCCTYGLKDKVYKCLEDIVNPLYIGNHPVNWSKNKKRKIW